MAGFPHQLHAAVASHLCPRLGDDQVHLQGEGAKTPGAPLAQLTKGKEG